MTGQVDDYEAIVAIEVRSGVESVRVSAIIDTGFSEFLTLPVGLLQTLGATVEREEPIVLGDGSVVLMEAHIVEIAWFGTWRSVKTYASEGEALIGMKLLEGCDLTVRVVPGGEVRVVRA